MTIETKENAKTIKKILSSLFGYKNVTVRIGTGTASGWISARVDLAKPENCSCTHTAWGTLERCSSCRQEMAGAHTRFNEERGKYKLELYTYCDDMGGDNECFNLSFDIAGV